jgi:hypothetical protein
VIGSREGNRTSYIMDAQATAKQAEEGKELYCCRRKTTARDGYIDSKTPSDAY